MNYYIVKTIDHNQYELSEPFETKEEIEAKYSRLQTKTKKISKVVQIPDIRDGLVLYKNGEYYKTITGTGSVYFLSKDVNDKHELTDMVSKESLLKWYIDGKIDTVEEYNDSIEFEDIDANMFYNNVTYDENEEIPENKETTESEE